MNLKQFLKTLCQKNINTDLIADGIINSYRGRPYHNLQHIQECINTFNLLQIDEKKTVNSDLVKLAIIFHDISYTAGNPNNERDSARVCDAVLNVLGLDKPQIYSVATVVELTTHNASDYNNIVRYCSSGSPIYKMAAIVCDCDLAILADTPKRFEEYEQGIRQEYNKYNDATFNDKRSRIFRTMLLRPSLFIIPQYQRMFESLARKNLAKYVSTVEV
jgi:predicted metal-dependent HD superfamily phosphohydrolase